MADIFLKTDVHNMLAHKTVYFVGDSNMRGFYKDFVQLIKGEVLINETLLKTKMEDSFLGDTKVYGTNISKNRNATEKRRFSDENITAYYYFVTKCYNNRTEIILRDMIADPPDIVIYNSCLWDVIRWGPNGPNQFKQDLNRLMDRFKAVLPEHTIVMWFTTPPISSSIRSSFLIKQVEFMQNSMRFEIMEANIYSSHTAMKHGYDCVDVHHYLRWQIHRRTDDGTHWLPHAVRYVTNLWLTHVALALDFNLPGRVRTKQLTDVIDMGNENDLDDGTPTHGEPDGVAEDLSADATVVDDQVQPAKKPKATRGRRVLRGARCRANANRPENDNFVRVQPNFNLRPDINFANEQPSFQFRAPFQRAFRHKVPQHRPENPNAGGHRFDSILGLPGNVSGVSFDEPGNRPTMLLGQLERNPYEPNYPGFEYGPPQGVRDHGALNNELPVYNDQQLLQRDQTNVIGVGSRGILSEEVFVRGPSFGLLPLPTYPLPLMMQPLNRPMFPPRTGFF